MANRKEIKKVISSIQNLEEFSGKDKIVKGSRIYYKGEASD